MATVATSVATSCMRYTPMLRMLRSVLVWAIFTAGAIYFNRRGFYPPHGNPFIYAIAMSWLIAFSVAALAGATVKAFPKLRTLARWEKEGRIYDRVSVRAFRWLLLHSPLGWINPNLHLGISRADCQRLLREMNVSEAVHWLTGLFSSVLAILCLVGDHAVYGYTMLLIRIPFDVYPIMLHRRNRGRVYRLLRRQTLK